MTRLTRLTAVVALALSACVGMDGTCRLVHVDSVKPFNGEICE